MKLIIIISSIMALLGLARSNSIKNNAVRGKLNVNTGDNVTMEWTLRMSNSSRVIIFEVKLNETDSLIAEGSSFVTSNNEYAKRRIITKKQEPNRYLMTITDTIYADIATLRADVTFAVATSLSPTQSSFVSINVQGGPDLCGPDPPLLIINKTTTIPSVNICGNPKPTVKWMVDGREIAGKSSLVNQVQQMYNYQVTKLDVTHCGKELQYVVDGHLPNKKFSKAIKLEFNDCNKTNDKSSDKTAVIAGILTGVVVLLILALILVYFLKRKKAKKSNGPSSSIEPTLEEEEPRAAPNIYVQTQHFFH